MKPYVKKLFSFLMALCLLLSLSSMLPAAHATDATTPEVKEIKKILTQLAATPVVLSGPDRCVATTSTDGLSFSYGWYDTSGQPVTGNFEIGYYDLVMRFSASDGYVIRSDVAAYLNNSNSDLAISVAGDGKSATITRRFEAAILRPVVFKNPGDEVVDEGSWVSYVATAAYYTDLTWELVSPDGDTTIDAQEAIQKFPGVNLNNNHVDKIVFYNVQASMDGWSIVAVFHGAEDYTTRSKGSVIRVTPDPSKTTTTPEPTPTPEAASAEETQSQEETQAAAETPAEQTPATPEPTPTPEHEHSFAEAWRYNEQKHWHPCTGCDEHSEEEEHSLVWTEKAKATRVSPGEEEGVCEVCGFTTTRETEYQGKDNIIQRIPIQYPIYVILGLIAVLIAAECIRSAVSRRK